MKEHLQVVLAALDKANKSGVFNLQESNGIIQSYSAIENKLKQVEAQEAAVKQRPQPVLAGPEPGEPQPGKAPVKGDPHNGTA